MVAMDFPRSKVVGRLYLPLAMGVLVLGLYLSSLDNPFMLDDHTAIIKNPDVVDARGVLTLWLHDFWAGRRTGPVVYQPLTVFSFYVNAQLTGLSQHAFRLVNMALLGLLGWVVAAWLSRHIVYKTVAWLGAFLFVAHPAHAELINHIVGRAQLLAMLGIVGFLLLHRLVLERIEQQNEQQNKKRTIHLTAYVVMGGAILAGLLAATVALLSAVTGWLLIPAVVLQTWVWRRRPNKNAKPPVTGQWYIHALVGLCLSVPAWMYWSGRLFATKMLFLHQGAIPVAAAAEVFSENPLLTKNLTDRLPAALSLVWFYIRQVFWPDTGYDHVPLQWPVMSGASSLLGLVVLVCLVGTMIVAVYKRHWLCLAPSLVLGQLFFITGLWLPLPVYASNQLVMPFTLATAMWLTNILANRTGHSVRKRAVAAIPCVLILLSMFLVVLDVNAKWFSTPRLMASDLHDRPDQPDSMYRYGSALVQAGEYGDAIYWLELATDLKPRWVKSRYKLALAYTMRGKFFEAKQQYQQILDLEPDDLIAHTQLASMALEDRDFDTAVRHIDAAKRISHIHPDVMYSQARLAWLQGDTDAAQLRYQALLILHPDHYSGRRDYEQLQRDITGSFETPIQRPPA